MYKEYQLFSKSRILREQQIENPFFVHHPLRAVLGIAQCISCLDLSFERCLLLLPQTDELQTGIYNMPIKG